MENNQTKAKMNLIFNLLQRNCNRDIEGLWCDEYIDLLYKTMKETSKEDLIEIIYCMMQFISYNDYDISELIEDLKLNEIININTEDEEE